MIGSSREQMRYELIHPCRYTGEYRNSNRHLSDDG